MEQEWKELTEMSGRMSKKETLFKLTDQDGYTRRGESGETLWNSNKTLALNRKKNPQLCSPDVIHAYRNINLGLLLNPQHANIHNPKIWECSGTVVASDWGKVGCFRLTTQSCLELPMWYQDTTSRLRVQIQFAILCAEAVLVHFESQFPGDKRASSAIEAAKEYLSNQTAYAARAAARAAAYAADAAAYAAAHAARAAARAAADAARAAAHAARAAAYAADAAAYAAAHAARAAARAAADAAYAAAHAARAAAYAATDAAYTARAAADAAYAAAYAADAGIDFIALTNQAVKMIASTVPPKAETESEPVDITE